MGLEAGRAAASVGVSSGRVGRIARRDVTAIGMVAAEVPRPADPSVPTAATFLRITAATLVFYCGVTFLVAWLGSISARR